MLTVSQSHSRIVERLDVQIGAIFVGLVEGTTPDEPLTLGIKKQDFFQRLETLTLDEADQLAKALTAYVERVRANHAAYVAPI